MAAGAHGAVLWLCILVPAYADIELGSATPSLRRLDDSVVPMPNFDFSCLETVTDGCGSIKDGKDCIASIQTDRQPCVWCGGVRCHVYSDLMCMPFEQAINRNDTFFDQSTAKLHYRMGGCDAGKPTPGTVTGTLGVAAPGLPNWRDNEVTLTRPDQEDIQCLQTLKLGCYKVRDQHTCLQSRDGREKVAWRGLKVSGEPCVWCGGTFCNIGGTKNTMCEPYDWVVHGVGVAFDASNMQANFKVSSCEERGLPNTPQRPHATWARHSMRDITNCKDGGENMMWTVPHIEKWGTCSAWCQERAAPTYPYGKLDWQCRNAWAADGNTCWRRANATCDTKFEYLDVAICQCQFGTGGPAAVTPVVAEETCDSHCASTQAAESCAWCGDSGQVCCKKGWAANPAACNGVAYTSDAGQCVHPQPTAPPTPPPTTQAVSDKPVEVYNPCKGKAEGDSCKMCAPSATSCTEPSDTMKCTLGGECVTFLDDDDTGGSGGLPWWVWPLLLALVALAAFLIWYFLCRDKKHRRSRAAKADPAESPMMSKESFTSEPVASSPRMAEFVPVQAVQEPISSPARTSFLGPSRFSEPRLVQQSVGAAVETAVVTQPVETVVAPGPVITEPVAGMDLFDMADGNHDGRVTEAEFAAAFGRRTTQQNLYQTQVVQQPIVTTAQPRQLDFFDMIDRNHDGRVSQQEFNRAFGAGTTTQPAGTAVFGGGPPMGPMITEPITEPITMQATGSMRPDMDLYTVTPYGTNVHHLHGAAPPPGVPIVSQALIPANLPIVEDNV